MSDFLNHWNLTAKPFEATWDTRFFFRSPAHDEALNRLLYLVGDQGMGIGLLTGEIGCGKTLTRAVLEEQLSFSDYQVAVCENTAFSLESLLGPMIRQLAPEAPLPPAGDKAALLERLGSILEEGAAYGRHTVLVLDEAQDLTPSTLEELRWITNFNRQGSARVTLILVGQPGLAPMVQASPAIRQRVSLRFHLTAMNERESAEYLMHRLRVAGHPTGHAFDPEAVAALHRAAGGVPRELNRFAKMSMEQAWAGEECVVSVGCIREVLEDFHRHVSLASREVDLQAA